MKQPLPLVVILLLTYSGGTLACRALMFGRLALDGMTVTVMIAVPLIQAAAHAVWRRARSRRLTR